MHGGAGQAHLYRGLARERVARRLVDLHVSGSNGGGKAVQAEAFASD